MRVVNLKEENVNGYYSEMVELARIFNHEVVDIDGVYWWRRNTLMCMMFNGQMPFFEGNHYKGATTKIYRGNVSLNELWSDMYKGNFSIEEMMKFYMQIGYSLDGYYDIFGQKHPSSFGYKDIDPEQNLIDFVINKYREQVLKI